MPCTAHNLSADVRGLHLRAGYHDSHPSTPENQRHHQAYPGSGSVGNSLNLKIIMIERHSGEKDVCGQCVRRQEQMLLQLVFLLVPQLLKLRLRLVQDVESGGRDEDLAQAHKDRETEKVGGMPRTLSWSPWKTNEVNEMNIYIYIYIYKCC